MEFNIYAKQYNANEFNVPNILPQVRTGSPIEPKFGDANFIENAENITFTNANGYASTLEEGTDYNLTYSNNKNLGTAHVIITFIGNYNGSYTKAFKITKATAPIESFKALGNIYVIKAGTTEVKNAKYDDADINSINDLIMVDQNGNVFTNTLASGEVIEVLSWVSPQTPITVAGTFTTKANFNPDPDQYNSLVVDIIYTIDKGDYTEEQLDVYQGGERRVL